MTSPDLSIPTERQASSVVRILGLAVERQALHAVLTAYIATRFMIFVIIFVSSITIPVRANWGEFLYAEPNNLVLDGLVRWDSWAYTYIIEVGYQLGNAETGERGTVAFFPLYPFLVSLISVVTGSVFWAGVVLSHIAFLVALGYLYALTRREFDDDTAARAVFYLAAAPTAVFFSAMYTESLFVALVLATFFYSRDGRWVPAAIAGALAAATRNTGVLLAVVVGLEGLHQNGVRFWPLLQRPGTVGAWTRQLGLAMARGWQSVVAAACVPLGLVAYMAYLANRFGDPLAFIHAQSTFGRNVSATSGIALFGNTIKRLSIGPQILAGQVNPTALLDLVFTVAFLVLIIWVARTLRPAHTMFSLLTLAVPLLSGTVSSMTRYILMLLPCFIVLAHWGRQPWVDRVVVSVFLPLMAYFTVLFSHWYFAG